MRIYQVVVALVASLQLGAAYGTRGAAERVLYYYAYLAEEITAQPGQPANEPKYTIAKDCGFIMGGRRNGRCSIGQFLQYLWSERRAGPVQDTLRPQVDDGAFLKGGENFEDVPPKVMWQRILQYKYAPTGYGVTDNIRSGRLVDGATSYYDALAKVGKPVAELQANPREGALRASLIVENGKAAASLTQALRFADTENWRLKAVTTAFTNPDALEDPQHFHDYQNFEIVSAQGKQIPNQKKWKKIDIEATIAKNEGQYKDTRNVLWNVLKDYEQGKLVKRDDITKAQRQGLPAPGETAKAHWAALVSATQAKIGTGCV